MKYRNLATKDLNNRQERFLREWQLTPRGIFLPHTDNEGGVFVWPGRTFAGGETVSIVAEQSTKLNDRGATLFVGVVVEEIVEEARTAGTPLEPYADAAVHEAPGIKAAIYVLNQIKGLPNGDRLALELPALMEQSRT